MILNLENIFSKNKLSIHLRFSQNGNIWRMYFTKNNLIAGETRDLEKKEVYFFLINYESRKTLIKYLQVQEKWWISICGVTDNMIFLSSYRKPDMPEYLGITALSIAERRVKWHKEDLSFLFADEENIYAYKQLFENKKYFLLDSSAGNIIREINGGEVESLYTKKQTFEREQYKDFIYPLSYTSGKGYFDRKFADVKLKGYVDYIIYENYLIYNWHEISGSSLTNKLEVFDTISENIVYDVILNKQVPNYVPDSFFIKDKYLFYVKEKTELMSVRLRRVPL